MDQIYSHAGETNMLCIPGRIVTLPSTFRGSLRSLLYNYQGAMAMIAQFGRPELLTSLAFQNNLKLLKIYPIIASSRSVSRDIEDET